MPPDFTKATLDILARRARFQCSNPDCRIHTVGPNTDPEKATTIGEGAHIRGAKAGSARYDATMSDVTRASITNGIWLCRNCHADIDRDEDKYQPNLLYAWRKKHEEYISIELGTPGERIRYEVEMAKFDFLRGYPEIIQRIAIDKPAGWEWRLAAELMRHLNKPEFKRLRNLRSGHYYRPHPRVRSDEFIGWVAERTHVMSNLIGPLVHLFDRLTKSFGKPGEPGDAEEMHDVCILIRDMLREIVDHEEALRFTNLPEEGGELRSILMDAIGQNAARLEELPAKLDEVIALIPTDHGGTEENPKVVTWIVPFEVSDGFVESFEDALLRYRRTLL